MNILWIIKLSLVYDIIYGIAGNETNKSLRTVNSEADENEPPYESETELRAFQRKMPEYPNTLEIPLTSELSIEIPLTSELSNKNTTGEASYSPPSGSEKNGNDITQNRCVECNVTYRYDRHYAKHCKDVHGMEKPFPCVYCKREFRWRHILGDHVNKEHGLESNPYARWKKNEPITCGECRETLVGWMKFEKHALSKHEGIKLMSCSHCPEKFLRRKHALTHEKMRHRNMEVKCHICKNIFQRSDLLKEHSEFCEQRQIQKKVGDNQLDTVVRYEMLICEECGREYKTVTLLRDHLRLEHPSVKLHPCGHCDAAFSRRDTLENHVSMLHPDKDSEIKAWRKYKRGVIYACEYCEGNFPGTLEYEKHGKRQHPGLPLFRCKDCGKGYGTRNSLKNHANEVHGGVKTRCSYCSKCYFRLWNHENSCRKKIEERERKRMAGYPKHYCDICSKDFYMKDHSFKNHVHRHKYYESCAICGQSFRRGEGGLEKHMERKHPLRENIEALVRTAHEVRTFVKIEKADDMPCTKEGTEGIDARRGIFKVKEEAPEINV